jgi:hypothetical protein
MKSPTWEELESIFSDYSSVAVYEDHQGNIQVVKISQFEEFNNPYKVLIHPSSLRRLRLSFVKFPHFVAFPTLRKGVASSLLEIKGWHGISYYSGEEFVGAWLLYRCNCCRETQRLHLELNESEFKTDEELKEIHLSIFNARVKLDEELKGG